jgi:hypothetical protein
VPLYEAFDGDPSDNLEPYEAIKPDVDMNERNPEDGPNAQLSAELPLTLTDRVPQPILDRILWQYVHGAGSEPPPAGPNASGIDLERWERSEAANLTESIAEVREELLEPYESKYGRKLLGEPPPDFGSEPDAEEDEDG